jgi:molybdopterin converting factor small subunit
VRVDVQLHATLAAFLPPGSQDGIARVDLPDTATIGDLIRWLAIPPEFSRVVLVNGHDVDDDAPLQAGDVIDVFPPLAGGRGDPDGTLGRLWEASRNPVGLPDFKSGVRL